MRIERGETWLVDCRIAPYENAGYAGHEPTRRRKLLLHSAEIRRLAKAVQIRGLTIVPTRMYFAGSHVKVEIALARGKKHHDKRETIKNRETDRRVRASLDV